MVGDQSRWEKAYNRCVRYHSTKKGIRHHRLSQQGMGEDGLSRTEESMMVNCPVCDARVHVRTGHVEMFGVTVETEVCACDSCGEEFLTHDQAKSAEQHARSKLKDTVLARG